MHIIAGGSGVEIRELTEGERARLQRQAAEDDARRARGAGMAAEKEVLVQQMRQHSDPVIRSLAEHV